MTSQPILFKKLSEALLAFQTALGEIGMEDHVTTFTMSDFGRTLTSNGDGTDHGWGAHQIIMGRTIKGGDIFGQMPDLDINGPDTINKGRFVPQYSSDQYAATLADWYGVGSSEQLNALFPNLKNFDSSNLGFMNT